MGLATRSRPVAGMHRLLGRYVAGPSAADAVRVAAGLVAAGRRVALEHHADAAGLSALIGRVRGEGLAGSCELSLPVSALGAAAADLSFVRCLNVLLAGAGRPAVAVTDPRLIAIAGERAAWYDRPTDSWEYVMPWGIRTDAQTRLVAAGYAVRVAVPSGPEALTALARRLGGRR